MASQRPKRSRRIVNYGEDHLHWIEESQLQKALLRSLNDKGSPIKKKDDDEDLIGEPSANVYVRIETKDIFPVTKTSVNKSKEFESDSMSKTQTKLEDAYEPRLTRLQSKLLEQAGMYYPIADIPNTFEFTNNKHTSTDTETFLKNLDKDDSADLEESDVGDSAMASRVRAQRKFASNSSPISSRNNSPVKMNKQKVYSDIATTQSKFEKVCGQRRAVRASSSSSSDILSSICTTKHKKKRQYNANSLYGTRNYSSSLFEKIPKTDTFLDYLCFRNTTLKVELHDCMKK